MGNGNININTDMKQAENELLTALKRFIEVSSQNDGTMKEAKPAVTQKKYYSVAEAAKTMNISASTLYGYISKKLISFYKPQNGKVYLTQEAIDDFILSETGFNKSKSSIEKDAITQYHIKKI